MIQDYDGWGTQSPAAGTAVQAITNGQAHPQGYIVLFIGGLGTLCSSVTSSQGSWTRVASVTGTGVSSEIWIGYNFSSAALINVTVNWGASTKATYSWHSWRVGTATTASPTVGTPATATGNSTSPDPGTVTPAEGNYILECATWANVTAASARTDTPGGKDQYAGSATQSTAATATRMEPAVNEALGTTAAHKRVYTITSGQWAACQVAMTMPTVTATTGSTVDLDAGVNDDVAIAPNSGHLYKGQDTQALDLLGSY